MSEYQYYEFQAIDRPLTEKEMRELRGYSTRTRITSTSFVNDYEWGDFKDNADDWMEKYFDAFLYVANWGTHVFKVRLPMRLLDVRTARMHCAGECMAVRERNGQVILTFMSEDEEGGDWVDGEGQLSSLISVRSELARGDLRALYLGWLLCAQSGDLDGDELEPPVPAGLAQLSALLDGLVEFLRIDTELVGVAAAMSPPLVNEQPKPGEVRKWLAKLSVAEKDDLLLRLMSGNDHALSHQIVLSIGRERNRRVGNGAPRRRTVADLLRAAERATIVQKQIAAERAAKEKARLERDAALARVKRLDRLAGKELMLWKKVEGLITTKQPRKYDEAVEVLKDLRDLAGSDGAEFRERVGALRAAHLRKSTLIERLRKAGL
jgi:hypothetical protein